MAYDEDLAARVRGSFGDAFDITERKMFGGIAFMLNGNMCCGVVNDDLMVRVGPEGFDEVMERPHVRPMDFTGRPMTGFIFVDTGGTSATDDLEFWVQKGVSFAETLPPKAKTRAVDV